MNRAHPVKSLVLGGLILLALGLVASCGKKAQPDAPEGSTYPRHYPAK